MIKYKTVMQESKIEQVISKSRFIGHVKPVEYREEAEEFIAKVRAEHKAATHNVPAFVIGDRFQLQWASDDGEPQGTSGAPIVQMLVKEEITNLTVVITRYFGGIKLGTGGLVRAYTGTAKLALEAGVICAVKELNELKVRLDYTFLGKLQNLALNGKFEVRNAIFEDAVTVDLLMEPEHTEEVEAMVSNLTAGSAVIVSESIKLEKVKI
ncbi:MAG: YigZ family protein [Eubacteriales bacterium]|nr:YigZ family protein [Eubacteriales bacterium]MDD3198886.1 YigZ family protein [Eubacteriales bacterium]MDD4122139.1 YigZ family protein [Eubacteriales bacterium]MDD4630081.1 YigZ family protein [Eubacteriales bacterium]